MKYKVTRNRYGNLNGYIGGQRAQDFGLSFNAAAVWALRHDAKVDDHEGEVEIAVTEEYNIEAAQQAKTLAQVTVGDTVQIDMYGGRQDAIVHEDFGDTLTVKIIDFARVVAPYAVGDIMPRDRKYIVDWE